MTSSRTVRFLVLSLVFLATAGCDQATKHLARTSLLQGGNSISTGDLIQFVLAENPGAFLSLGASLPEAIRHGLLTVGVVFCLTWVLAYLLRAPRMRLFCFLGLALVWAGGMSNLIDRVWRGGLVTDFLIVQIGPWHTGIFNIADFAVVVGILLFAAASLQNTRAPAVQTITPARRS